MRSPERPDAIFATRAEAAHFLVQQARQDQHTADQARAEGDREAADVYQERADAGARTASRIMARVGLPVSGTGGEIVPADKPDMVDTLKDPSLGNIEASGHRINLLDHAGALTLGLDVAETIGATNSVEKLLAHQIAAAHALGLRFAARATLELDRQRPAGAVTEAARLGLVAARLMEASQKAALTIARLRSGAEQTVVVQRVHVKRGNVAVAGAVTRGDDDRGCGDI